jgi:hypothetical protein
VEPNASLEINRNVLCLIGANTLGKSTLLTTLIFGITGAIPDPDREFRSAPEYLQDAAQADRIDEYFTGRISELNRPLAAVTVELTWQKLSLTVTRNLFEESGASSLKIKRDGKTVVVSRDSGEAIEERYRREVLSASGLPTFAQFVFLYHFVFTFDEGRHLITWDNRAVTTALYLAFGSDDAAATRAERLRRAMEREASRARNVRFAAKTVSDRILSLEKVLVSDEAGAGTDDELVARRDALEKELQQAEGRLDELNSLQESADLRWTEVSAAISDRQVRYRQVFAARAARSSAISYHPVVRTTIEENRCAICRTEGVGDAIAAKLKHGNCPLCGSAVGGEEADDEALTALRALDAELLNLRKAMEEVLAERDRLVSSRQAAAAAATGARTALEEFLDEGEAGTQLERLRGKEWISGEIAKLQKEQMTFAQQAVAHRKKRDEFRSELRTVERQLRSNYEDASLTFVPRFRELAQQFIGLPIDVELEQRTGAEEAGFRLKLTMDDKLRTSPERLSESQRFFLDIALRMALGESMTEGASTLLIDTPEGSLDIAYEARAGQMFNNFAKAGNYIVMTANLRTSELLMNLARLSGRDGMEIIRMTDWTELTDVQAEEEARLDKAFSVIAEALG